MQRINPFKPTAGMNPPELIGRDEALDDFAEALENGPGAPDRLLRISGVRGTGKTVLLNALGDPARKQGFQVVDVASNPGFCDCILSALRRQTELRKLSLTPSVMGLSIGSVELARMRMQQDGSTLPQGDLAMLGMPEGAALRNVTEVRGADA